MRKVAAGLFSSVDQWANSTLINGSVAGFLSELRQRRGGTIGTAGSPSLVWSLINQGLLGELTLMISPAAAGRGPQAAVPGRRRADQVRTGRSPAGQQRRTDRDLPADPVAEQC